MKTFLFALIAILGFARPALSTTMFGFHLSGGPVATIAANEKGMLEMSSKLLTLALQYAEKKTIGPHAEILKLVAPVEEIAEAFKGTGKSVFWHQPGNIRDMKGYITLQKYLESKKVKVDELIAKGELGKGIRGATTYLEATDRFHLAAGKEGLFADGEAVRDFKRGVQKTPVPTTATAVAAESAKEVSWLARAGGVALKTVSALGVGLKGAAVGFAGYQAWDEGGTELDIASRVIQELNTGLEGHSSQEMLDHYKKRKEGSK